MKLHHFTSTLTITPVSYTHLFGIVLVTTKEDGILENKVLNSILDKIINLLRAVPFIILLAVVAPVSYTHLDVYKRQGQEAMGICLIENEKISEIKGRGLVSDNIKHDNKNSIGGYAGIGHVKYESSDDDITTLPMPWQYYPDGKDQVCLLYTSRCV